MNQDDGISQKGALSSLWGKGRGWEATQNQAGAGIAWGREDGRAGEGRDFHPLKTRFTDRCFDGGAGTLWRRNMPFLSFYQYSES